jgi:uncharacterized membrane protein YhaH (DUF805 family)
MKLNLKYILERYKVFINKPIMTNIFSYKWKINRKQFLLYILLIFVVQIFVVWFSRSFIAISFVNVWNSMYPTYKDKEYFLVEKLSYRFSEPKKWDVVVFGGDKVYLVKRIIWVHWESIEIKEWEVYKLLDNEYFVIWDNKNYSENIAKVIHKSEIVWKVNNSIFCFFLYICLNFILFLYVYFCIFMKRLRDTNLNLWWGVLFFIPIVSFIFLLFLVVYKGNST